MHKNIKEINAKYKKYKIVLTHITGCARMKSQKGMMFKRE